MPVIALADNNYLYPLIISNATCLLSKQRGTCCLELLYPALYEKKPMPIQNLKCTFYCEQATPAHWGALDFGALRFGALRFFLANSSKVSGAEQLLKHAPPSCIPT